MRSEGRPLRPRPACPGAGRSGASVLAGLAAACLALAGCFTEIGNPGKEQTVSARFRIDYTPDPDPAAKTASNPVPDRSGASGPAKASAPTGESGLDSLRILQFYFNVVEINYDSADQEAGRIWKVPDSLGKPVDFTGNDPQAGLPPVAVPPITYSFLKLESRIPAHAALDPDTIAFGRFSDRGYIKGIGWYAGAPIRFLCQFTNDYKINLVYTQEILEQWRQGNSYQFDFVFYATHWLLAADLASLPAYEGVDGPFVLVDEEHNPEVFTALRASFFKSFNSSKVWKENPAP
jgi:hypothetical protein